MNIRRTLSVVLVSCAALLLSGCFVTSVNLPAGNGPMNDQTLVGDWRGIDADSGKDAEIFIHIQDPDQAKPLRVLFVEGRDYQVYDLRTVIVGSRKVFTAKLVSPPKAGGEVPPGYFLGFYEVKGNEMTFSLLDSEKVGKLISQGKVKGTAGKARYDLAQLTGSPAELSRFLSSPEAWAARVDEPTRLRRLSPANK